MESNLVTFDAELESIYLSLQNVLDRVAKLENASRFKWYFFEDVTTTSNV